MGVRVVFAALTVSHAVGGVNHFRRHPCSFLDYRIYQIRRCIRVLFQVMQLVHAKYIVQKKPNIVKRCLVLHDSSRSQVDVALPAGIQR